MAKIDDLEFIQLRDYIVKNLHDNGQKGVAPADITIALWEFGDKFDLSAMCRFRIWMAEHGYDNQQIFTTIIHDLNGRHDRCFLPRTSGY